MKNEQSRQQQVKVRYNETSALFASQFIINTSNEDLTINFSSGPISDSASGESILPIHTRMAMTLSGAQRLYAVLGDILKQQTETPGAAPASAQAQLPSVKQ
jgi:hypothetical protein